MEDTDMEYEIIAISPNGWTTVLTWADGRVLKVSHEYGEHLAAQYTKNSPDGTLYHANPAQK